MTDYSDIPQVNTLYNEQQNLQSAIAMIDAGGTWTALTISPPPPLPYDPSNPVQPVSPMMMVVRVENLGDIQPETMTAIRAQLVARGVEIDAELAALGVVNAPAVMRLTAEPPPGAPPPAAPPPPSSTRR